MMQDPMTDALEALRKKRKRNLYTSRKREHKLYRYVFDIFKSNSSLYDDIYRHPEKKIWFWKYDPEKHFERSMTKAKIDQMFFHRKIRSK